jgi:leucyl/phenylalanyl-tRNA--protein transferase
MIPWLERSHPFPPTSRALSDPNGLLAAGADLSVDRLISAYSMGIFPWYSPGEPILWWSPNPRMVLHLNEFKTSLSLSKTLKRCASDSAWQVTIDRCFADVIQHCAAPRDKQSGTWIVEDIQQAYIALHKAGFAHSIEAWWNGSLVGGLYLVNLGHMVFGESMFHTKTDASKIALCCLAKWLKNQGGDVIDCQQNTRHLASFGAREVQRLQFESYISERIVHNTFHWNAEQNLLES